MAPLPQSFHRTTFNFSPKHFSSRYRSLSRPMALHEQLVCGEVADVIFPPLSLRCAAISISIKSTEFLDKCCSQKSCLSELASEKWEFNNGSIRVSDTQPHRNPTHPFPSIRITFVPPILAQVLCKKKNYLVGWWKKWKPMLCVCE